MQCLISALPFPKWARKWVNIRKAFSNFYGFPRLKLSMMLDSVGMVFEGNEHSGSSRCNRLLLFVCSCTTTILRSVLSRIWSSLIYDYQQYVNILFTSNVGIDDARNIARIVIRMLEDGCDIQKNERISRGKLRKHALSKTKRIHDYITWAAVACKYIGKNW